jgi:ATP-dependent DNA helicase DinG
VSRTAADGLARQGAIPGYTQRPQQVEMAQRIAAAIARTGMLVAEAGTGTGKTFAYLVPALLAGGKVIVSTGTKTLQDQLFERDLPAVRDALGVPVHHRRCSRAAPTTCATTTWSAPAATAASSRDEEAGAPAADRALRQAHAHRRPRRMREVPEDSGGLALATSTRDNCLGQDCPEREGLLRDARARGARGRRGGGQPPPVLRRRDAARRRRGRAAAGLQHGDLRRGAPAARHGDACSSASRCRPTSCSNWRATRAEAAAGGEGFRACRGGRTLEKAARDLRLVFREENARFRTAQADDAPEFAPALATCWRRRCVNRRACSKPQAERARGTGRSAAPRARGARIERWRDGDRKPPEPEVRWAEVYQALR